MGCPRDVNGLFDHGVAGSVPRTSGADESDIAQSPVPHLQDVHHKELLASASRKSK